jgi:hypothetical protein
MTYLKSYLVLVLILNLLVALVPTERMRSYIRFFAGLLLSFCILTGLRTLYENVWGGDGTAWQTDEVWEQMLGEMEALYDGTAEARWRESLDGAMDQMGEMEETQKE